jgi:hypothetical protein
LACRVDETQQSGGAKQLLERARAAHADAEAARIETWHAAGRTYGANDADPNDPEAIDRASSGLSDAWDAGVRVEACFEEIARLSRELAELVNRATAPE